MISKETSKITNNNKYQNDISLKNNWFSKDIIIIIIFSLLIILILFNLDSRYNTLKEKYEKLGQRIEQLESQVTNLTTIKQNKKLKIGIVIQSLYGNGIGRYLTVLSELLAKTEKYEVFLINEQVTNLDFPYYKEVKRIIQKKDETEIVKFDKNFDLDIYILNNETSNYLEIYKA